MIIFLRGPVAMGLLGKGPSPLAKAQSLLLAASILEILPTSYMRMKQ